MKVKALCFEKKMRGVIREDQYEKPKRTKKRKEKKKLEEI